MGTSLSHSTGSAHPRNSIAGTNFAYAQLELSQHRRRVDQALANLDINSPPARPGSNRPSQNEIVETVAAVRRTELGLQKQVLNAEKAGLLSTHYALVLLDNPQSMVTPWKHRGSEKAASDAFKAAQSTAARSGIQLG